MRELQIGDFCFFYNNFELQILKIKKINYKFKNNYVVNGYSIGKGLARRFHRGVVLNSGIDKKLYV
jgi:hypothetical protein